MNWSLNSVNYLQNKIKVYRQESKRLDKNLLLSSSCNNSNYDKEQEICHHSLYCRELINFHFSWKSTRAGLILIHCLDLPLANCKYNYTPFIEFTVQECKFPVSMVVKRVKLLGSVRCNFRQHVSKKKTAPLMANGSVKSTSSITVKLRRVFWIKGHILHCSWRRNPILSELFDK